MNVKKLLFRAGLGIATLGVVVGGAAAFSAFEAHIINVTATIENALLVDTQPLSFGTVFPQEHIVLDQPIRIALSESFLQQSRVTQVEYVIKQKPKVRIWSDPIVLTSPDRQPNGGAPANQGGDPYIPVEILQLDLASIAPIDLTKTNASGHQVSRIDSFFDIFVELDTPPRPPVGPAFSGPAWSLCENYAPAKNIGTSDVPNWVPDWSNFNNDWYKFCYPVLGPYLSKDAVKSVPPVPSDAEEDSLAAFHNPYDPATWVHGHLTTGTDPIDTWRLDVNVPCFVRYCAQDWTHLGWELPKALEHQTFGTDLWVEVSGIANP